MNEIEELFYDCIRLILPAFEPTSICRVHQAFGQPSFSNTEDRIFFDVFESESNESKQVYFSDEYDEKKDRLTRTHERTITYNVVFTLYGPNSYANSVAIRDGFYTEAAREKLKKSGFFIVPYHQITSYYPEQLCGVWYQRYDFEITFNRSWSSASEELNYIENTTINVEGE